MSIRLLRIADKALVRRDDIVGESSYAILSHRWLDPKKNEGQEEIVFDNLPDFDKIKMADSKKALSASKIERFCEMAGQDYEYVWLDTCCVDQKNPAELSASINSMFRWYQDAAVCYVYLRDYDSLDPSSRLEKDEWFDRGWTLQELIAPRRMEFFDTNWITLGRFSPGNDDKLTINGFMNQVYARSGVNKERLIKQGQLERLSIAQRMSWYNGRETKVPEDNAYCLMGIFQVNMPTLYGEGKTRASRRLQEEIMKYSDDHSLFAWTIPPRIKVLDPRANVDFGLLAPSPDYFKSTGEYYHQPSRTNTRPFTMTNKGLEINLYIMRIGDNVFVASLECPTSDGSYLSIYLKQDDRDTEQYYRINADQFCFVRDRGKLKSVFIKQPR